MGGYRSWTTCKPFQSTMGCFRIVDALLFWLDPKLRFWSDQINSIYLKMYFLPTRSKKGLKESILQRSMRFMIYGNKIGMPQGWLVLMGFGFVWWDFLWIGRLASSCSPPSCYIGISTEMVRRLPRRRPGMLEKTHEHEKHDLISMDHDQKIKKCKLCCKL